ncbi:MAG: GGDEF domain-containing protein [Bdellovibrionales bacterium]|nr:GGDEF domain-containing protein [Bdellovibrionales bacterium]
MSKKNEHTSTGDIEATELVDIHPIQAGDSPALLSLIIGPKQWIGKTWFLTKNQTFGRDKDKSDVYIPDNSLSRAHVRIIVSGKNVQVQDVGSTNGSFLNNQKMDPEKVYTLNNSDILRLGEIVFKFVASGNIEAKSIFHVQDQMYTDPLCQIHNRKYMEDKGQEMIGQKKHVSFISFDLDHFKKINDQYGHIGGDFILTCVSSLVRNSIRKSDVFCRMGGEEFSLMIECDKETALQLAEEIRNKIANEVFEFEDQSIRVSVSLGVAEIQKTDKSWQDLYKRADKALYQSKKEGRNRVS